LLACKGDVLAWESTANNVSCSRLWVKGCDVVMNGNAGKVLGKNALAKELTLNKPDGLKAAELMRCKREAANACKGVEKP